MSPRHMVKHGNPVVISISWLCINKADEVPAPPPDFGVCIMHGHAFSEAPDLYSQTALWL